jgi:hypothetical protein
VDRKIATERVEKYNRIDADRLEADRATVAQLAAKYLEEDATHARVVAADRLETDQRLAAERLKIDALNAEQVAVKRQKTEKVQAEKTAAERLKDDVKLELEFAEADRRLDAERLEAPRLDRRILRRTVDKDEGKALQDEIRRVVAECFEENEGGRVFSCEFQEVFAKATVLTTYNPGVFKNWANTFFLAHWTNSRTSMFRNRRCFTNMAVKLN